MVLKKIFQKQKSEVKETIILKQENDIKCGFEELSSD